MLEAGLWGLIGGSSLLLGALVAFTFNLSTRSIGLVMGFGSGVLISAVAYELAEEAFEVSGGSALVAAGAAAGAFTFYLGDTLIDRMGGHQRKRSGGQQAEGVALAVVLGIVLDGIPESVVIGASLLEHGSVALAVVAAVFLSNLPEALAASTGLAKSGMSRIRIGSLWTMVTFATGVAAALGFALLDNASPDVLGVTLAFAGGAILTMLADTMMPEAYEEAGKEVGLLTVLGFSLAFLLTSLD